MSIPVATANLMLDAGIGTLSNGGKLRLYDGIQPAGGGAVTTQVLLAEFQMADDAFPPASAGVLTANAISSVNSLADGIATWYRLVQSNGTLILDGSVGIVPGLSDLIIDDATIVIDQVMSVITFIIFQPLVD